MQDKYHKAISLINRQVSLQAFQKFVLNSAQNQHVLFKAIRDVETTGFPRFNVWRLLLGVIPINGDWEQKRNDLQQSRKRWSGLKQQSKTGKKASNSTSSPIPKNPLMKNMFKTQKKQVDNDPFLNEEIKKDVDRTYQEMEFFQDNDILRLLTNVLFVWCKINSQISYKQGMNQLLASIVYVYFQQAIPAGFEPSTETQQKFILLNSLAHAEADIFSVFEKIMDIQKDMYKESLDSKIKGNVNPNSKNNSPILQRIIQIQDHKLKSLDLELFKTLKLQDVKTKTFLLRWIRCLHTRQFGLFDSLYIWDCIFLDAFESPNSKAKNQYQFVDAMCLAMFIYMRSLVFTRETANQITVIYQKFPQLQKHDLKQLISLGWSVCEELRALHGNTSQNNNNSCNTSNWYEDSGKSKGLGLMDTGKASQYKNKPEKIKQYDFDGQQNLYPQVESPEKVEKNSQKRQQAVKKVQIHPSPTQNDKSHKAQKIVEKKHDPLKIQTHSSPLNHHAQKSTNKQAQIAKVQTNAFKIKRQIIFEESELKGIIENMKKSIALNDDIQSRSIANQVLKVLQDRLKK